jgi:hypothetical protein
MKILKQYVELSRVYSNREPSEGDAYILNTTTQLFEINNFEEPKLPC